MNLKKNSKRIHVGEFKTTKKIRNIVLKILDSGRISEGYYANLFEKKWAEYIGTKFSVALNSGTSSLIAGLEAIKNKYPDVKNSKIITTPLTYIATSNSILLTGFSPIFVDIEPDGFCISPEAIRAHLENVEDTKNYSIILPVHLLGYPVDMDKILKIAKEYDLLVVEDSAQAHGTIYKGKKVGNFSLFSAFSFYIAHNIQAGQLGAVVSNDKEIVNLTVQIKSNGRMCTCGVCTRSVGNCPYSNADFDPRFTHNLLGYNFRPMEFQAAIALAQLEEVEDIIKRRQNNVKMLNEYLAEFSNILDLPKYSRDVSYLAYPIIIKDRKISLNSIKNNLELEGIETRSIFSFIPDQLSYSYLKSTYQEKSKLPNAKNIFENGFYIGCHQYLNDEDLEFIYKKFIKVLKSSVR